MSDIDDIIKESQANIAMGAAAQECVSILVNALQNTTAQWHALDDTERERLQEDADQRFRVALFDFANALASGGFTRIPAIVDAFNLGKTNVAKLIVPEGTERHLLHALGDAKGSPVTIVIVPINVFDPPKKDKDSNQGELALQTAADALAGEDDV